MNLPEQHREPLVVMCVRGDGVESLAAVLACDEASAASRHEAMLLHMGELARPRALLGARPRRAGDDVPLDWAQVMTRYEGGKKIPTVAGGKTLEITGVDEAGAHIRHALWRDTLAREHLEKAADLIGA